MSIPEINYKELMKIYLRGNHILWKKGKRYFTMDKHLFTMPFDEDKDLGIKAVMGCISHIKSTWEPFTTKRIKKEIKKGMIVVDVGASIGYFTLLLARCVGKKGKVFSFEPTPNQFPYLLNNIKANGYSDRVMALNIAAWDNKDGVKMPPIDKKFDCSSTPVDDILKEEGVIDKIDFIKIDVDGSEAHVLRGLKKTFEANPNLQIMFEYYSRCLIECGEDPKEVVKMVEKYFTHEVIPFDVPEEDGANWWCKRKIKIDSPK